MDKLIDYLKKKYAPIGLIVYGSFADGTNDQNSDLDALLVTADGEEQHDHSQVFGTELDVFIYPRSRFTQDCAVEEFIQIWNGRILMDQEGLLEGLKERANAYIIGYTAKSRAENEHSIAWCEKMLERTKRGDMEGFFRLHWLLIDSLEIYFDLKGQYYFGPKKALRQMRGMDDISAGLYDKALRAPTYENVRGWVDRLKESF